MADRIHASPEIKFEEHKASRWLSEYLEKYGFQVSRGIAGLDTAFQAVLRQGEGPVVAFLCEYDALPKIGHACGHNLIGAASVSAAVGLAKLAPEFSGTVMVLGTPAEEGGGGKISLLDAGIFQGIDVALMVHPSHETIILREGLGRIKITIEFHGQPAHAACRPNDGKNALDAMISFFVSVGLLRQQLQDNVRIHGIITHGGEAPNVIPDFTAALFYIRGLKKKTYTSATEKLLNCARGAAIATGTEVKFEKDPLIYEPRVLNAVLGDLFKVNLNTFNVGEVLLYKDPKLGEIGSSDIGNVSQVLPTLQSYIKISDAYSHTADFAAAAKSELAHERLIVASKTMAMTALDLFMKPEKVKAVWADFKKRREIQPPR